MDHLEMTWPRRRSFTIAYRKKLSEMDGSHLEVDGCSFTGRHSQRYALENHMRKTFQVHGRLEEDGVGFLRLEHPGQRFAEHLMTAPPQTGKKAKPSAIMQNSPCVVFADTHFIGIISVVLRD